MPYCYLQEIKALYSAYLLDNYSQFILLGMLPNFTNNSQLHMHMNFKMCLLSFCSAIFNDEMLGKIYLYNCTCHFNYENILVQNISNQKLCDFLNIQTRYIGLLWFHKLIFGKEHNECLYIDDDIFISGNKECIYSQIFLQVHYIVKRMLYYSQIKIIQLL